MEALKFVNSNGVCGLTIKWDCQKTEFDAQGWLARYGPQIGRGVAPCPDENGYVDLSQFAAVYTLETDD